MRWEPLEEREGKTFGRLDIAYHGDYEEPDYWLLSLLGFLFLADWRPGRSLLEAKRFRRAGKNRTMEWIEQIFHVSPDAGNGSLELLLILCPFAAFLVGFLTLIWFSGRMPKRKGRKK